MYVCMRCMYVRLYLCMLRLRVTLRMYDAYVYYVCMYGRNVLHVRSVCL